MPRKHDLVVYGCGGHARAVVDIYLSTYQDANIIFVDEAAKQGEKIFGYNIVTQFEYSDEELFLAIGDNESRLRKASTINQHGLATIVSNRAYLGTELLLDRGVFVGNYCHLGCNARIGLNSIINTGAIVEHETKIGSYCHIGPGAVISGRVQLGDQVFVGAGSTIIDKVSVCSNVVIGAGSVVIDNIHEPGTYVGCPVRKLQG